MAYILFSFLLNGIRYNIKKKKLKNLIWFVGFYYLTFLHHLPEKKSLKFRISTCLFGTQALIFLRLLEITDFQLFSLNFPHLFISLFIFYKTLDLTHSDSKFVNNTFVMCLLKNILFYVCYYLYFPHFSIGWALFFFSFNQESTQTMLFSSFSLWKQGRKL